MSKGKDNLPKKSTFAQKKPKAERVSLTKKKASTEKKSNVMIKKPTDGPELARLVLASYLIVILLLQLFMFHKFPAVLQGVGIEGDWAYVSAIALVTAQLATLPFLLGLRASPGVKNGSLAGVFIALVSLTAVEIVAMLGGQTILFGATFDVPGGSWSIPLLMALWVLAIWGILLPEKLGKVTD